MFNDDQTFCVDEFRVERVMKMKKNTTKSFDCGSSDVSFFIEKTKKYKRRSQPVFNQGRGSFQRDNIHGFQDDCTRFFVATRLDRFPI